MLSTPGVSSLVRRPPSIHPDGTAWQFIHFEARRLQPGERLEADSGPNETALIFLGGHAQLALGDRLFDVAGRSDVWDDQPPWLALLPPACPYSVNARTSVEVIVVGAAAEDRTRAPRLIAPDDMLVERRGEGQTLRVVHHLLPPSADAQRLILVEVYTPAGNWSSFPPHKQDTDDPPRESYLEESF
jgi:5-deoxy-glucuronate isomerase